jgi:hypothetical protein
MQTRLIYFVGILFLFLWVKGPAASQEPATVTQEQSIINDQQITSGNQSINFPASTTIRGFSVPGNNPLPSTLPTPSHFAPPVTDGNYGSLIGLLVYKNLYTMADAEALLKNLGKIRTLTTCYLPENLRKPKGQLRIVPDIQEKDTFRQQYEAIGIGNYKALDTNTISEQVLGMAIKEGLTIGADVIVFQEGAALVQVAKGYSIGLFNSFSISNSPNNASGNGNVTVAGLGFGKGETGYSSKPWLRVQFFREISHPPDTVPNDISNELTPMNDKGVSDFEETLKKAKEPTPEEKFKGTHGVQP